MRAFLLDRRCAVAWCVAVIKWPCVVKSETFMNDWMSLAASWLPFLVLIALWFWYARTSGMRARGSSGASLIELYEQQVAESRRMNVNLERIASSLEKREGRAQ